MADDVVTLADMGGIAAEKARIRIDAQRQGFDRLAAAIAKAGYKDAARQFRAEAERAIERAVEFQEERLARDEERATLNEIRNLLDTVLPDRKLTDAQRVAHVITQWRAVSRELATTEAAGS